ncbi:hypothetical protein GQX74_010885 [Glossina fuscipes]|nr:hypothetical protein GQX74_010885 [Glossina fuscipes]
MDHAKKEKVDWLGNADTTTKGIGQVIIDEKNNMINESESQSDSDPEYLDNSIELRGYLNKWTNYIYGWRPRYIVLKDGTLSYYKSESESDFGCRGVISLRKAIIKTYESDELRFDVVVNNSNNWCLQDNASTTDTTSLKRHGSNVSLQSTTISVASGGSLKRTQYNLNEKIDEIETFKKILFGQIETLQRYFDVCAETNKAPGESITFRATTTGVLNTLQHCLEIISERALTWKRKLEREIEKRKKLEEQIRKYKLEIEKFKNISYPGPDFEEGPHSPLPEDEFFDAVETGLDKIEEDMQLRAKLKLQTQLSQISVHSYTALGLNQPVDDNLVDDDDKEFGTGSLASGHSLWPEIDRVCEEQLQGINLSNP